MSDLIVYTKNLRGPGHRKTKLSINMDGLSYDDLVLLARARICQRLQWEWQSAGHIPDEYHCNGLEFIQPPAAVVDFSKYKQPKVEEPISDEWSDLLAALPEEEKQQLIKQLEALR